MDVLLSWLESYRYLALFVAVLLEGPIVMVVGGFLVKTGFFAATPAYLILVFGDLVGDVVWYGAGRYGAEWFIARFGKYFSLTPERMEKVKALYRRNDTSILFISKITMGLGLAIPVLVGAGLSRVPFRKYMLLNLLGEFIWTGSLMALGYFFATAYGVVSEGLRVAFMILMVFLVGGATLGFSNYMRNRFWREKT